MPSLATFLCLHGGHASCLLVVAISGHHDAASFFSLLIPVLALVCINVVSVFVRTCAVLRPGNKSQLVFEASFVKLLANKFSSLYQHSSNLGIMWEPIVRDWFRRLFVSKIPFSVRTQCHEWRMVPFTFHALFSNKVQWDPSFIFRTQASLRMLDAFLHEGNKILYRYVLKRMRRVRTLVSALKCW